MKKAILLSILFIMCMEFYAQNMVSCVDRLDFCHMYCEMSDGRYGTVGILGTGNTKEINGLIYTEINIGALQENGSVRVYKREGDDIIMYSLETMLQEGESQYYRQEGKRVFAYSEENNKEELVLDFSLNVGDTFVRANGERMKVVEVTDTIPFVYSNLGNGKKLVLQSEDESGKKDVWVEGLGSLNTGILSCNALNDIRLAKLIGCSVSTSNATGDMFDFTCDISFCSFTEEHFNTRWLKLLEIDESQSPQVNYDFLDDTLHLYGYMERDCVGSMPLQCMVSGNKIEINEIVFPGMLGTSCTSVFKVEAKFPGFEDGTYQVSYNGGEPVEVVCGEVDDIHTHFAKKNNLINNSCYDLTGRPVSTPSKGVYIRNGKKVLVK